MYELPVSCVSCTHAQFLFSDVEWGSKLRQSTDMGARDYALNTPLHLACSGGNREVAEYLIKVGCSTNAKNLKKDSLIHVAVQNGHKNVTELLLVKGVSTESLDAQKCTPAHIAAKHNKISIIKLLKKR